MAEKVQDQMQEMNRKRVESFLKEGAEEGDTWKEALGSFEEEKKVLANMKPEDRMGLIDSMVKQWLPRKEQPAGMIGGLLKKLSGEDETERLSYERERADLNGAFRDFLNNPSIDTAVPILRRLNIDMTNSEKLEEFTRRVGRITFTV